MSTVTITDHEGDDLTVEIGSTGWLFISSDNDDISAFHYAPEQRDEVRKLRDALNGWLGENAGELRGVRASEVSFNEGILRLAVVHEQPVTFRYAKGDGSHIEQRTLRPEGLFNARNGALLVGGTDPDRDEYRAYRVDRIKGEVTVA